MINKSNKEAYQQFILICILFVFWPVFKHTNKLSSVPTFERISIKGTQLKQREYICHPLYHYIKYIFKSLEVS